MKKLFILSLLALAGLANAADIAQATSDDGYGFIVLTDDTSVTCRETAAKLGGTWQYIEIRSSRTSEILDRGCWHHDGYGRVDVRYASGSNFNYQLGLFRSTDYFDRKYRDKAKAASL